MGLSVRQLARFLGVTASFVAHVESGRRGLPPALAPRLLLLSRLLPPPLGQGLPAPEAAPAYDPLAPLPQPDQLLTPSAEPWAATPATPELPPAAGSSPEAAAPPLRRRLRDCRLQLLTQGQRLTQLQARAAALAHRRWAIAQLQAAPPLPEPAEAARYARWLGELVTDLARDEPDPAAAAAARHLLAARVASLRAEAAVLAAR